MAAVTALEPNNPRVSTTTATVANTDAVATPVATEAAAPLSMPTPDAATRAVVTADARSATEGLAAPRLSSGVQSTEAPQVTLAQYQQYWDPSIASRIMDPGLQAQMNADASRISQMINSCSFLGLFCFDGAEEQETLAILNRYPPEIRGAFVERLASMGLLQQVMDRTSGYESSALNMLLRQSLSGMSSPQAAAQVLERMYPWGNESTVALAVSSLMATNSPAFADAVLMELVQRGVFTRGLSFWSPMNMYGCDSFYDILQRQSMSQYLESQRMQSMARLESILSTFPPGSQAAALLRTQLAQQYSMERLNDQLSTLSCLSQDRYQSYYHQYYPNYYSDYRWFPEPRYPSGRSGTGLEPSYPRSGTGLPGSGTGLPPRSGTGLPPGNGSGTGLPPRSGTGLPGSGTGLPGSGTGLPPRSGTGLGTSPGSGIPPRNSGSGTGLGTSPSTPSTPSYTPPRSSGSGTGLGTSPSYTPPRSTPSTPSYTPPRSSGSGTGLGSSPSYTPPRSTPSYTPPSYTPPRSTPSTPSYTPPRSSGSGTGLGSSPSYSSPSRSPSYSSPSPSYSSPSRSPSYSSPSRSGGSGTGL